MLKLRAMQMVLVLFYVEELKREIVDAVQATDGLMSRLQHKPDLVRVPSKAKDKLNKCLGILVADGVFTRSEQQEIISLINFRNHIGHEIHKLVADLSSSRYARERIEFGASLPTYDHDAMERLQRLRKRMRRAYTKHHYVHVISLNKLLFDAAEKTFIKEIARLKQKASLLGERRNNAIDELNAELSLVGTGLVADDVGHPRNRYRGEGHLEGRLTKRGVEVCYRLFDFGKSPLAVAQIMRMSLRAALKRKEMWLSAGGKGRERIDIPLDPPRRQLRR